MPVTAKLSREFYDRFGDKVVDELVGLLNDMDAAFRAELRDLNEENFRRFEAKLEQRVSERHGRPQGRADQVDVPVLARHHCHHVGSREILASLVSSTGSRPAAVQLM
jgi:hypothetical protein